MTSSPSVKTASRARMILATGSRNAGDRAGATTAGLPAVGATTAFTLVEVVIAITVLGILTGIAVPAISGVQRERLAREPVNALLILAREVRLRAMKEQRPYQIIFDSEGFKAARFFQPYGGAEEFETLRVELEEVAREQEIIDASRARGIDLSEGGQAPDLKREEIEKGLQFFESVEFDPSLRVSLKIWDEVDWVDMSGGEFRRWIFQPSGMCEPMRVKVEADDSFFEIEFHPLTADVKSERSWVE